MNKERVQIVKRKLEQKEELTKIQMNDLYKYVLELESKVEKLEDQNHLYEKTMEEIRQYEVFDNRSKMAAQILLDAEATGEKLSMRDVAKIVGVSHSAISLHLKRKRESGNQVTSRKEK